MATRMHTRCLKWNNIGKRSTNGGLFPWAKRQFRNRTNHKMRKHCQELQEWENEILAEKQFKSEWLREQQNFQNWQRFVAAMIELDQAF